MPANNSVVQFKWAAGRCGPYRARSGRFRSAHAAMDDIELGEIGMAPLADSSASNARLAASASAARLVAADLDAADSDAAVAEKGDAPAAIVLTPALHARPRVGVTKRNQLFLGAYVFELLFAPLILGYRLLAGAIAHVYDLFAVQKRPALGTITLVALTAALGLGLFAIFYAPMLLAQQQVGVLNVILGVALASLLIFGVCVFLSAQVTSTSLNPTTAVAEGLRHPFVRANFSNGLACAAIVFSACQSLSLPLREALRAANGILLELVNGTTVSDGPPSTNPAVAEAVDTFNVLASTLDAFVTFEAMFWAATGVALLLQINLVAPILTGTAFQFVNNPSAETRLFQCGGPDIYPAVGLVSMVTMQFLYFTIALTFLRTFSCTYSCPSPAVPGGDIPACFAVLDADPGLPCWTSQTHVIMCVIALILLIHHAALVSFPVRYIVPSSEQLDVRFSDSFVSLQRLLVILVNASYVFFSGTYGFVPFLVQELSILCMVVYLEYYKPAIASILILQSTLYQLIACILVAAYLCTLNLVRLDAFLLIISIFLAVLLLAVGAVGIGRYLTVRYMVPQREMASLVQAATGSALPSQRFLRKQPGLSLISAMDRLSMSLYVISYDQLAQVGALILDPQLSGFACTLLAGLLLDGVAVEQNLALAGRLASTASAFFVRFQKRFGKTNLVKLWARRAKSIHTIASFMGKELNPAGESSARIRETERAKVADAQAAMNSSLDSGAINSFTLYICAIHHLVEANVVHCVCTDGTLVFLPSALSSTPHGSTAWANVARGVVYLQDACRSQATVLPFRSLWSLLSQGWQVAGELDAAAVAEHMAVALQCPALDQIVQFVQAHVSKDLAPMMVHISGIVGMCRNNGQLERAIELSRYMIERIETAAGKMHPDLIGMYYSLGKQYGSLGEHALKRQALDNALVIVDTLFGAGRRQSVKIPILVVNDLAKAYGDLGDAVTRARLLAVVSSLSSSAAIRQRTAVNVLWITSIRLVCSEDVDQVVQGLRELAEHARRGKPCLSMDATPGRLTLQPYRTSVALVELTVLVMMRPLLLQTMTSRVSLIYRIERTNTSLLSWQNFATIPMPWSTAAEHSQAWHDMVSRASNSQQ